MSIVLKKLTVFGIIMPTSLVWIELSRPLIFLFFLWSTSKYVCMRYLVSIIFLLTLVMSLVRNTIASFVPSSFMLPIYFLCLCLGSLLILSQGMDFIIQTDVLLSFLYQLLICCSKILDKKKAMNLIFLVPFLRASHTILWFKSYTYMASVLKRDITPQRLALTLPNLT